MPPDPGPDRDWPPSGSQDSVGYVVEMGPGGLVSCWLDLKPQHMNSNNLLHGGFTAMLLDIACGYVASQYFDPDKLAQVVTVSLSTHFIAAVQHGRVTATGRVSGGGRSLCHVNGELRNSDGILIATATGVFKRIFKAPKA